MSPSSFCCFITLLSPNGTNLPNPVSLTHLLQHLFNIFMMCNYVEADIQSWMREIPHVLLLADLRCIEGLGIDLKQEPHFIFLRCLHWLAHILCYIHQLEVKMKKDDQLDLNRSNWFSVFWDFEQLKKQKKPWTQTCLRFELLLSKAHFPSTLKTIQSITKEKIKTKNCCFLLSHKSTRDLSDLCCDLVMGPIHYIWS